MSDAFSAWLGSLMSSYGSYIFQVLLMLCFAFCYHKKVVESIIEKKGTLEDNMGLIQEWKRFQQEDFTVNICECFVNKWVCLTGCFCPLSRMGHTNEVAGIMGFWETAIIWCCCAFLFPTCGPCCLTVYFRMLLKKIMNVKDNPINDIVIACCCPGLAICQQGQAVDREMGYEMDGCCAYEWLDGYADQYGDQGVDAVVVVDSY